MLSGLLFYLLGMMSGFVLALAIGRRMRVKRLATLRASFTDLDAALQRHFEPDPNFEYKPFRSTPPQE